MITSLLSRGILVAGLLATALPAYSQNTAAPVFSGFQTDLIEGIEDDLATGNPKVRHIYVAAPDTVGLIIDAQALPNQPVVAYEKLPGDTVKGSMEKPTGPDGGTYFRQRQVIRNGVTLGQLVGAKENLISPGLTLEGAPLDLETADNPASYTFSSPDDPAFAKAVAVTAVYRKSKPEVREWVKEGVIKTTSHHELFLKLAQPLAAGKRYTLNFKPKGQFPKPVSFTFDDARLRTEALHVNQVGYHPRQAEKVAFLSLWMGDGGGVDYSRFKKFRLVDAGTGKAVFDGDIALRNAGDPGQKMVSDFKAHMTDTLPMPVYALDFSAFATPGKYRLTVPGLGASFPFAIDETVWDAAARVSARGFLSQRAGIAMGPPYTTFVRPRNLHPADGITIHEVDPRLYFAAEKASFFERIQASILMKTSNPEAWGSWMDAGDHDRDILPQHHTRAVHAMLDLYESNPAFFEKFNLNIPESGNKIPDILNEALWGLDMYRRLQHADGAVPSAVESIEHPVEPSYALSLPTAVTPSTPQTCHLYAAAAAQMALDLAKYDPALAARYRQSAIRAMAWADGNAGVRNVYQRNILPAAVHENHAAAWMYRLTGEQSWHERFKQTFAALYPGDNDTLDTSVYTGPWGLVDYALMPEKMADPVIQQKCRAMLVAAANRKAKMLTGDTLHLGPSVNWEERIGQPWELVAAHRVTRDPRYLLAMLQTAQFGLGANPTNTSYTTGLGSRTVVPFHLEALYLGENYPEGITTGGPLPRNFWHADLAEKMLAGVISPAWENWPWAESNFNIREAIFNEHVIAGSLANTLLLRGYLAQELSR